MLNKDYAYDTGWIDMQLTSSFKSYSDDSVQQYRRIGKTVFIRGVISPTNTITGSITNQVAIATLPEGFRPTRNKPELCQGTMKNSWYCEVKADGTVTFSRYGTTAVANAESNAWLPFDFSFPVD